MGLSIASRYTNGPIPSRYQVGQVPLLPDGLDVNGGLAELEVHAVELCDPELAPAITNLSARQGGGNLGPAILQYQMGNAESSALILLRRNETSSNASLPSPGLLLLNATIDFTGPAAA